MISMSSHTQNGQMSVVPEKDFVVALGDLERTPKPAGRSPLSFYDKPNAARLAMAIASLFIVSIIISCVATGLCCGVL